MQTIKSVHHITYVCTVHKYTHIYYICTCVCANTDILKSIKRIELRISAYLFCLCYFLGLLLNDNHHLRHLLPSHHQLGLELLQLLLHPCHLGGCTLQLLQTNLVSLLQLHHLPVAGNDEEVLNSYRDTVNSRCVHTYIGRYA